MVTSCAAGNDWSRLVEFSWVMAVMLCQVKSSLGKDWRGCQGTACQAEVWHGNAGKGRLVDPFGEVGIGWAIVIWCDQSWTGTVRPGGSRREVAAEVWPGTAWLSGSVGV